MVSGVANLRRVDWAKIAQTSIRVGISGRDTPPPTRVRRPAKSCQRRRVSQASQSSASCVAATVSQVMTGSS